MFVAKKLKENQHLIIHPAKVLESRIKTLHSLCQDPASPGGANPTYAPFAGILSLLTYLGRKVHCHQS